MVDEKAMGFPVIRPRRLRVSAAMRKLVRETALAPSDFVYPLFFSANVREPNPIASLPGGRKRAPSDPTFTIGWPCSSFALHRSSITWKTFPSW